MSITTDRIRNIAIIAHVDHGKTTLVDKLFHASGTVSAGEDRLMDSNELERERGITILAKNTGIQYNGYKINIVDTPGHSDFGGEVERTLQMVEGFLLLVDAAEGVLPGTRFVLSKALALNLRPIVVINKIDRPDADIERTESSIHDLFLDLATDSKQLEFPVLYGSSRYGFMTTDPSKKTDTMQPLLDAIVANIPSPKPKEDTLQFLCTNLDYSEYLGPIAIGRVFSGSIKLGQQVVICKNDQKSEPTKITKIFGFEGIKRIEQNDAIAGEIVAITGFNQESPIGSTICDANNIKPLEYVSIDEPTVSINIGVNDSPFNGKEGTFLTSRHLKERLTKELKTNVALRVEQSDQADVFKVSGRGQLHLSILIETMRREGFELQVSAPQVIYKTIDGQKSEPIEFMVIDIPGEYQGIVMERLGRKKADLQNVVLFSNGRMRMEFKIPSRGLLGFKSQFLTDTRGTGIATFNFHGYEPYKGEIPGRTKGSLVSIETDQVTAYALDNLQERGILFVEPGTQVYEGMIVGEHSRDNDLEVNPCKGKKLTNMRASGTDDQVKLPPAKIMDLETCLEWIQPDELIEVTPKSIRLRKKGLKPHERKRG
jgi:GTP-binding protein